MTSHAIMTQTLPTVVGMGTVSRATETMFTKQGKARASTKRKGGRVFAGKTYYPANWHPTKAQAERDAQYFRKAGHPARVARYYNPRQKRWGYMVYVR